ncbi:MAG: ABC transporter permease [Martelella sp.]|jgi:putative spermidine/putrescine transport system permease protein|uniref:Trehalose transport system permease protein SugB n=1 Tax=Martelella mediterranea DSM 17316 TaxID=1122214 RepID=A0A1U9Z3E4_9HYPH|nr:MULTISPECIES: ABC transporter permease [Martelella]AQZ52184.1 Trehalose transport system permease protein SugB [Martelella mediterranea DSM 17316]MAU21867.1 ABC transporter permease [Martelella sp.]|tara:strand:+ start:2249 stop:3043 length:795 start_codon:yes stop_codon:yes gene_type:complete
MKTYGFAVSARFVWTVLAFVFLLAPIAVLIFASFDDASFFRFPPNSYSLRWYEAAIESREYRSALSVSLLVAVLAGFIAVLFGAMAAFALVRYKPAGGRIVEAILMTPLVLPLIVWAIALLQIYSKLGMSGTLPALVLAHAVITMPFSVRIMVSTFADLDPLLEQAAATLGASPGRVVRRITLPLAMPGLVSSAAFSVLISFNDVIVSSLIAGARWITFPVRLYAQLRSQGIDPITLAIGSAIVAFILVAALIGEFMFKWSRRL